jgi:hypothetical protein
MAVEMVAGRAYPGSRYISRGRSGDLAPADRSAASQLRFRVQSFDQWTPDVSGWNL